MLGDVDFQGSSVAWLKRRGTNAEARGEAIVGWAADPRRVMRPPAGVTHVVLDTPGGLRGLDLAKVVMAADVLLVPVSHSVFDRESAADCVAELRQIQRVAAGRCRIGVIGMRLDGRTRGEAVVRAWAEELGLPFLGALRETQNYVRCAERGLTVFDLPASRAQADLEQWQPILDWLQPALNAAVPGTAPEPDAPLPLRRAAPQSEPARRPRFSPSTAQVPLDVLEGPRQSSGWLARLAGWFGHAPSRRRPLRST
jgi:chromosome partitioning protein